MAWELAIDVGGTFTDCVASGPDGELLTLKLLSSGVTKGLVDDAGPEWVADPARSAEPRGFWAGAELRVAGQIRRVAGRESDPVGHLRVDHPFDPPPGRGTPYEIDAGQEAPIVAIRRILGLRLGDRIEPISVRLGTTRGTNALLTRRGARVAFVTTRGFGDLLHIGFQDRPRLFELEIVKRPVLFERVIEVDERVDAAGEVLRAPDPDRVRRDLEAARRDGYESLAICLLHGYAHPENERQVAGIAREVGFANVSVASELVARQGMVARAQTTVLDAYLSPVLSGWIATLRHSLGAGSALKVMTSAGGLVEAGHFRGKDSILSGPAGGVVGLAHVSRQAGISQAVGFDMGGTSTDVSRFDGAFDLDLETEKAGIHVVAPTLSIETVAAGGGSICRFDGFSLAVGPQSAGSDPGPACYGRGGPLTVTDLNLLLGKLPRFPFPLDRNAAERRLAELCAQIVDGHGRRPIELAEGLVAIANAAMARAIRAISVHRGYDPAEYTLVPFGAAAGQHACALARELSMTRILAHPQAGILSAVGLRVADVRVFRERSVLLPLSDECIAELGSVFRVLEEEAREDLSGQGVEAARIMAPRRTLDLRYHGVEAVLTLAEPADRAWGAAYEQAHQRAFGYLHDGRPIEIVAARVEVAGTDHGFSVLPRATSAGRPLAGESTTAWFAGEPRETPVLSREELHPGDEVDGPAIVCEPTSTLVIDPGWHARVTCHDAILLTDRGRIAVSLVPGSNPRACGSENRETVIRPHPEADPVGLEIWSGRFASIAEQMGLVLRKTATSTNVKERLDYSCALFSGAGDLVVNAPHIPVHLGAMSETVRRIVADEPAIRPGDVFVTNDPYRGGSHLPDVTVVTPVHSSGALVSFVASRAHHADIGGVEPGSMPPFSRCLADEGILIRSFKLVDAEKGSRQAELEALLSSGLHPSRAVRENLADVAAQVAANRFGVQGLEALFERHSADDTLAWMQHLERAAASKMRAALGRLEAGRRSFVDHLDDGSSISVSVTIDPLGATIDFAGTSGVVRGNLNANEAIVTAAVLYVFRCLVDDEIPLNAGVLAPLSIRVPPGCLLAPPENEDPSLCAAVVGGNVETSQRIVDALLGALGRAAASQGTMNNLAFGDGSFGYYETICGGAGATPKAPGADAVHTHMTNTRLTDPEVLEHRYPVRLLRFAVRRGSGGAGRHRGGDGVVREMELLRPLRVSILSERRGPYPPFGLDGGEPGAVGRNLLWRAGRAEPELLTAKVALDLDAGDRIVIETPGGGGWGKP
ncbi:MAG: hydantoinase B/oxoprolinase family protein [Deltaproteobacteria bacterium]|nr:hydantoinase B/oxoprolinase family protein [Deltaproteobacteria bacterium]